jgi:hypothetical protein
MLWGYFAVSRNALGQFFWKSAYFAPRVFFGSLFFSIGGSLWFCTPVSRSSENSVEAGMSPQARGEDERESRRVKVTETSAAAPHGAPHHMGRMVLRKRCHQVYPKDSVCFRYSLRLQTTETAKLLLSGGKADYAVSIWTELAFSPE